MILDREDIKNIQKVLDTVMYDSFDLHFINEDLYMDIPIKYDNLDGRILIKIRGNEYDTTSMGKEGFP